MQGSRILLLAILAQAQPAGSLVHIAGFVVDLSGNPVQGAAIVHAGPTAPITDAEGRFEVDTSAPAFVIRKSGFRSEFVRINSANVPRITIQKLKETMTFPTCSGAAAGNEGVLDARGEFANGNRWRSLGRSGETAVYSDVDEATARILDRFLDRACLSPAP
jgi:hypothetical protein